MDSNLPHCTICLKPLVSGWRCDEHKDVPPGRENQPDYPKNAKAVEDDR